MYFKYKKYEIHCITTLAVTEQAVASLSHLLHVQPNNKLPHRTALYN